MRVGPTYLLRFSDEPRTRIRTSNVIERLNREIRRRVPVVGGFPDGNSALCWSSCARLRHVAGAQSERQRVHEYEAIGCH